MLGAGDRCTLVDDVLLRSTLQGFPCVFPGIKIGIARFVLADADGSLAFAFYDPEVVSLAAVILNLNGAYISVQTPLHDIKFALHISTPQPAGAGSLAIVSCLHRRDSRPIDS